MFHPLHHLTLSFVPVNLPGAVVSSGLFLFAAAGVPGADHLTGAEQVTFSLFKVAGIIGAVAVGSWTTSRKLKSIEDAIIAGDTARSVMKKQMDSMQKTVRLLTCYSAPSCQKRVSLAKKKKRKT